MKITEVNVKYNIFSAKNGKEETDIQITEVRLFRTFQC